MTHHSTNLQTVVGYLAIIDVPELGYCGGLLLVNLTGRPVEFHCTSPVEENRAQRILYGKTYEPFLFCDQIGRSLIDKAKNRTRMLFVQQSQLSRLESVVDQPVLHLGDDHLPAFSGSFSVGGFQLSHNIGDLGETETVVEICHSLASAIPLDEPFERIRMAIDEAQSVAR